MLLENRFRIELPGEIRQLVAHVDRRLVAPLGILLETASDHPRQMMRQVFVQEIDALRGIPQDRGDQIWRGLTPKRSLASRHLEEHHTQGEDVGSLIHLLAHDLLRRHVGNSPEDSPFPCDPLGSQLGLPVRQPKTGLAASPSQNRGP